MTTATRRNMLDPNNLYRPRRRIRRPGPDPARKNLVRAALAALGWYAAALVVVAVAWLIGL